MEIIKLSNRLTVGFQGADPVIREIYSELSAHNKKNHSNPDIVVRGEPINFETETFKTEISDSNGQSAQFGYIPETNTYSLRGAIRRHVGLLGWKVKVETSGGQLEVTIGYDQRIRTSPSLLGIGLRYMNRSFVWRYQNLSKILLYNLLEPIFHNELINKNSAYIHASSVEYEGKGLLFTGSGGSGKTSLMDGLVTRGSHSFISDDLCLISQNGHLHPYLKRVQVYPYNISKDSDHIVNRRASAASKVQWELRRSMKGSDGVRRRILPEKRYDVVPNDSEIPIETAIFLQRGGYESISVTPIKPTELSRRSLGVILEEFNPMIEHIIDLTSNGSHLLDIGKFVNRTSSVYQSMFQDCNCFITQIPNNADIEVVREKVYNIILE